MKSDWQNRKFNATNKQSMCTDVHPKKNLKSLLLEKFLETLSITRAITWVTFLEIIRDKVLYNFLFCTAFLFGLSYLAAQLTYGIPIRVLLDFGLSILNLSGASFGLFIGATLLQKEFFNRTILINFSRPITRFQFLLGKFCGLSQVLLANWFLLSLSYCTLLYFNQTDSIPVFSKTLFYSMILAFLQSLCVASMTLFFSCFLTTSLSLITSFGIYIIGNNIDTLQALIKNITHPVWKTILHVLFLLHPNFEHFQSNTPLVYQLPLPFEWVQSGFFYSFTMSVCFLIAGSFILRWKEV